MWNNISGGFLDKVKGSLTELKNVKKKMKSE